MIGRKRDANVHRYTPYGKYLWLKINIYLIHNEINKIYAYEHLKLHEFQIKSKVWSNIRQFTWRLGTWKLMLTTKLN